MTEITSMTRRMIRAVATRGRVIAMLLVAGFGITIAAILRNADVDSSGIAEFAAVFGLTILVPLVALVIASATIGTLLEDQTLIYFWLRPFGRWKIAIAALIAGAIVLVPLVLVPMGVIGVIGGGADTIRGVVLATVIGILGYGSVFTLLGSITKRALVWGLGYILVWEGIIAGFSRGAGLGAMRTYTTSALARIADIDPTVSLPSGDLPAGSTIAIVTVATVVISFVATTFRLHTMRVD